MNSAQTKICQNCKKQFTIELEDFQFYEKIKVPPPTFCPQCRMLFRFASMNIFKLYRKNCAKCGKSIITINHPDSPLKTYCGPCWWADDWDGTEFGRDYDSNRPFFEQLRELMLQTPFQSLENAYLTNVNSDYTNHVGHLKNCYLIFFADFCENAFYSFFLNNLKDSLDCSRVKDGELLYECIGMNKSYRCYSCEECDSCVDTWFSRACFGCHDCLGCINLRGKSFYIFNKPYKKEEYFKTLEQFNLSSRRGLAALKEKTRKFWLEHPYRVFIGNTLNVNVTGDYIYESKNVKDAYMVSGAEDCRYVQCLSVASSKDCYDYTSWGNNAERIYSSAVVGENSQNVKFSLECWPNVTDIEYSIYATSSRNVFGCVNLKKKEYAILNKVYPKEEFFALKKKIIADMQTNPFVDEQGRRWSYGDYLPVALLPYAYNESFAADFFTKTKEEAVKLGFEWHREIPSSYKITLASEKVPDNIQEISDDILKETLACAVCGSAFRIVPQELALYRLMKIPVPVHCPMCRIKERFERCTKPELHDRKCAKCGKDIKTAYSPDRKEIVYCEQCYNAEVV